MIVKTCELKWDWPSGDEDEAIFRCEREARRFAGVLLARNCRVWLCNEKGSAIEEIVRGRQP
jgi:hypothetical protein